MQAVGGVVVTLLTVQKLFEEVSLLMLTLHPAVVRQDVISQSVRRQRPAPQVLNVLIPTVPQGLHVTMVHGLVTC